MAAPPPPDLRAQPSPRGVGHTRRMKRSQAWSGTRRRVVISVRATTPTAYRGRGDRVRHGPEHHSGDVVRREQPDDRTARVGLGEPGRELAVEAAVRAPRRRPGWTRRRCRRTTRPTGPGCTSDTCTPNVATSSRSASRDRLHRVLGRVVVAAAGEGEPAAHRAHVHDPAPALARASRAARAGQPGQRRRRWSRTARRTSSSGRLLDRALQRVAGVVDQHTHRSVVVRPPGRPRAAMRRLVGDVEGQRPACRRRPSSASVVGAAGRRVHRRSPAARQPLRRPPAADHAGRAAGDGMRSAARAGR